MYSVVSVFTNYVWVWVYMSVCKTDFVVWTVFSVFTNYIVCVCILFLPLCVRTTTLSICQGFYKHLFERDLGYYWMSFCNKYYCTRLYFDVLIYVDLLPTCFQVNICCAKIPICFVNQRRKWQVVCRFQSEGEAASRASWDQGFAASNPGSYSNLQLLCFPLVSRVQCLALWRRGKTGAACQRPVQFTSWTHDKEEMTAQFWRKPSNIRLWQASSDKQALTGRHWQTGTDR